MKIMKLKHINLISTVLYVFLLISCTENIEIQPMPAPWILLEKGSDQYSYIYTDDTIVRPRAQGLTGWVGTFSPKIIAPSGIKQITIKKNGELMTLKPLLTDRVNYEYDEFFDLSLLNNLDTCEYLIEVIDLKDKKSTRKVKVLFSISGQRPTVPIVSFAASPVTATTNQEIQFYNHTINGSTYVWNFGDDSTSTALQPKHKYQKIGKFTVTLTARNYVGENTLIKTEYITITLPSGMVADAEGNVYSVKTIGTQTWMTSNLRATKFRNGEAILNEKNDSKWCVTNVPAFCYVDNNSQNAMDHGCLYNHFAVVDSRGIAPVGWHVASDYDWAVLQDYLIANRYNYDGTTTGNKIAKSMASSTGWIFSDISGTVGNTDYSTFRNKSGFSALASGVRTIDYSGSFVSPGTVSFWWSATSFGNTSQAYCFFLTNEDFKLNATTMDKKNGYSVRCVKD